ncbi:dynein regulatory complex protein 1-like [Melanaphis sacchari]|uniref:dynein regulatory complex protein 1-like n=1 Tax=Melanaphis sacchari TaxID=742174 RepID=UPI000DC1551D|nr:dynein regulatory complex protein 1-like [Melanaphis sacchari]
MDVQGILRVKGVLSGPIKMLNILHDDASRNNIEALHEKRKTEDSDENLIVLEKEERKVLRKCNIWRRQNIDSIENAVAKRKFQQKMIVQQPVVDKIENSEFELGSIMEELNNFIEGKCLIFQTNEYEHIYDELEKTSNKKDILVIQEDIVSLKKDSLDLLKQKDSIIDKLLEGLEELLTKSFNETSSNSNDLDKLNKIANNKLKILKEEHKKHNLAITGVDTDLEFVKIRCSTNIEKLKYNCHVLKKRIEDNNFRIVNQKRRINILQETVYNLREKCKKIESDHTTQISTFKKQIININQKIDQQEKRADSIAKKDNDEYVQLWDFQLNQIIRHINCNSSFVFEHNLNGIFDSNPMRNLSYAYNALSELKLNKEESWHLIKSKFKPFVTCITCNSQINWESALMNLNRTSIYTLRNYAELYLSKTKILTNLKK